MVCQPFLLLCFAAQICTYLHKSDLRDGSWGFCTWVGSVSDQLAAFCWQASFCCVLDFTLALFLRPLSVNAYLKGQVDLMEGICCTRSAQAAVLNRPGAITAFLHVCFGDIEGQSLQPATAIRNPLRRATLLMGGQGVLHLNPSQSSPITNKPVMGIDSTAWLRPPVQDTCSHCAQIVFFGPAVE